MCGIAGVIGVRSGSELETVGNQMLGALARRGPDDEGRTRWEADRRHVLFGHRRLAIFDLSPAGHQPMLTPDGRLGVVFNGAIYNFGALRAELERAGATFRSRTDTEVLLHGYRAWGIDALVRRLEGMFAFAIWDADRETCYLVRDRLGVKPLAYALDAEGGLAFASTVRALNVAGARRPVSSSAVVDVLEYGYVDEAHAMYEGIRKLPPATILEWSAEGVSTRTYWSLTQDVDLRITFDEAVEECERLLLSAVELRLQADVPVGALLSGGVDSALVCWAIRHLGADITAFTIGTPGHASDESADAVSTASEIGIPHRLLALAPLEGDPLGELTAAYPEPFAIGSALGMLRVSRAVREEATVLLTGDGGDDVFLGYPRHLMLWRAQRLARRVPAVAGPLWRGTRRVLPDRGMWRRGRHAVDYTVGGLGAFLSATPGLPALARLGLVGERLRDAQVPARGLPWSVGAGRQVLDDYLRYDRQHQFVAEYLAKVDGATMQWALEARSPFLDHRLWEFATSLPYAVRMQDGVPKAVLREVLRRRVGPRAASGRKRGFVIPVERWVLEQWRPAVRQTFADSELVKHGWVDGRALAGFLARTTLAETDARLLWHLLVLERWMQAEASSPAAGGAVAGHARA